MKKNSSEKHTSENDRHLDTPSEANRDKHINFVALENNDADPADERTENKSDKERKQDKENNVEDNRPMHTRLTNNPRHATDETSTEADSPRDNE